MAEMNIPRSTCKQLSKLDRPTQACNTVLAAVHLCSQHASHFSHPPPLPLCHLLFIACTTAPSMRADTQQPRARLQLREPRRPDGPLPRIRLDRHGPQQPVVCLVHSCDSCWDLLWRRLHADGGRFGRIPLLCGKWTASWRQCEFLRVPFDMCAK
jgi:hypothetical protein